MLKEFEEFHEEELADYDKYMKMAEDAPLEYKSIFMDIAKEEQSHAKLIEAVIKDYKSHCFSCESEETSKEDSDVAEETVEEIKNTSSVEPTYTVPNARNKVDEMI